ncbi:MAG: hypothetical protein HUU16_21170, partial [Candidatus Omnitrophica bacterium]|nr:hypothetical protein [Candidatus Omnitrophota bacterium]
NVKYLDGAAASGGFILSLARTGVLFSLARVALDEGAIWQYWLLKFSYVGVAFGLSIFVSTAYEEWIISVFSSGKGGSIHFFPTVFKANLAAFLVGGLFGAATLLPERLKSPNFLVRTFEVLFGPLG